MPKEIPKKIVEMKQQLVDKKSEAYGFWRTVLIVLCGHLGVRTTAQRKTDFERASGVHVFIVALMYFLLIIIALIVLVNYIVH